MICDLVNEARSIVQGLPFALRPAETVDGEKIPDEQRGLYAKYHVERKDGSSAPGKKHHDCEYFVLDLDDDRHALPAIQAYAWSCRRAFPALARDLAKKAHEMIERWEKNDPTAMCAHRMSPIPGHVLKSTDETPEKPR